MLLAVIMKMPVSLYLDVDVVNQLRQKSQVAGAKYSNLANVLLEGCLKTFTDEQIRALVPPRQAPRVVVVPKAPQSAPAPFMVASVRRCFSALTDEFQEAEVIRSKAQQSKGINWRALRMLQEMGLAVPEHDWRQAVKDALGRPLSSNWRKVTRQELSNAE